MKLLSDIVKKVQTHLWVAMIWASDKLSLDEPEEAEMECREILTPDTKLTPHVTVGEYACNCGCGCGTHPEEIEWDVLHYFEAIRKRAKNFPFFINSACRCPEKNAAVGGGKNSSHLRGTALDLYPVGGWNKFQKKTGLSRNDFVRICEEIIGDGGVGRDRYKPFGIVHIDRDRELMAVKKGRRW